MNNAQKAAIEYDDRTVRRFLIVTLLWGTVAMLVGVIAAFQLNFWQMNGKFLEVLTFGAIRPEGLAFLTFGRLRPLHTNAAIFTFVGNMMFAGVYYSTQRLCKARMAPDFLSSLHFWGWQLIIVAAAVTLPAGLTRGKEYAELIWPINVAVAVIWVVFALNFFLTLKRRNEPSLYVATIITVAMLCIVNHLSLPTSLTHSYPVFGGVQDALVQWWYGHNAVAFFLTTPILGIMYYFMPKAADRPVYSYRLSIVHFWSLVFIYIWAGPHHLLHNGLVQLLVFFAQQLSSLAERLLRAGPNDQPGAGKKACSHMRRHFDREITLAELSRAAGVSAHHLCAVFKESTGVTMIEYLNRERILQAKKRLLSRYARISEVAFDVGFGSLPQFNRCFAKYAGESPTEYRRRVLNPVRGLAA